MIRPFACVVVLVTALGAAACSSQPEVSAPTRTTSAPVPPSYSAPASPAEVWQTEGGPASPGAPTGTVVDPRIEEVHDGGVW
jgi:hypothetical protein